ncbi:prenyltransferase/squalene oxidase repeat-containing protein [Candidatus Nitronereus thalassa]|uniref:Terpene cyclase/mutase family protein n=1 Tax=Candidatus Nitronereus thalassa TaxID=3020898 RepID=A0ABU3K3M9_9BACT|nr:prenyltransferase/squalene oxidase repeat-containing protein [Candidatus Nitronereus thalassa]MDT7040994.1 terpene cyclase/mutase family protein [Candidatus Nitronereus thalassa]
MEILLNELRTRIRPNGGFLFTTQGEDRPDATAWGTIILSHFKHDAQVLQRSRDYLTSFQMPDGRVSLSPDHPESFWPTPISILAWETSKSHHVSREKAIQFLLNSSGEHWIKNPETPLGHDPSLKGWPWIGHTHSWVESTAMAMTALHNVGFSDHPRLKEATSMILDRQLSHGGWNYGNTMVFEQELKPSPEDTGAALSALAGRISRIHISKSLEFLQTEFTRLRTPIAVGWSLLGLNAWNETPPDATTRIHDTWKHRERFGGYDTPSLCLLLAPLIAPHGLNNLINAEVSSQTSTATLASM